MNQNHRIEPAHRRRRIAAGSLSAVPTAIVVAFAYERLFHEKMDQTVAVALASLIGSLATTITLCFHDLRALICGYLIRKRFVRNRRNTE